MSENTEKDINMKNWEIFTRWYTKRKQAVGCYSVMKVHSSVHEVLWESESLSTKTIYL